jgi:hypothetical protein
MVLYCTFQAGSRQAAGKQAGRKAAVRQAGRQAVGQEGKEDGRKARRMVGGQEFRQTDICKDRQMYRYA